MRPSRWLFREALATARAQRVSSLMIILVVAGMCVAVFLTAGRSAGTQEQALRAIDGVGARTIIISADSGSGLNSTVVSRLTSLSDVTWVGAFGPAKDVSNAADPSIGATLAVRDFWSGDPAALGMGHTPTSGAREAWASSAADRALGLADYAGAIRLNDGGVLPVVGQILSPKSVRSLQPLIVQPQPTDQVGAVSQLIIVANSAGQVDSTSDVVAGMLGNVDGSKIHVATSDVLVQLRTSIDAQLGTAARTLTLGILVIAGGLMAAVLYGLVMLRRREFGRRRAVGARRSFIVAMIIIQTCVLSVCGAAVGTITAGLILWASGAPVPAPTYLAAVSVIAISTASASAIVPAVVASRRDPAAELRVP